MTESQFYRRYFRSTFHRPPESFVYRVEDYGLPDVFVVKDGVTRFFELKTLEHLPVREGTPFRVKYTPEQKRTLSQINRTQSRSQIPVAFFLVAVAREGLFYLFTDEVEAEIFEPDEHAYLWGPLDSLDLLQEALWR